MNDQETVRCGRCELKQFRQSSDACKRCGQPLTRTAIEVTKVIVIASAPVMTATRTVVSMREVMRIAAKHAVEVIPHTTKAAKALGIPHVTLKKLLREAGDDKDRRYSGKPRKAKV